MGYGVGAAHPRAHRQTQDGRQTVPPRMATARIVHLIKTVHQRNSGLRVQAFLLEG